MLGLFCFWQNQNHYGIMPKDMNSKKPFIVALAGGSGSGKTTLARIVASSLPWPVTTVPLDQFYKDLSHLSLAERADVNFDHPDSLDMDEAVKTVAALKHGVPSTIPTYDFSTFNRLPEVEHLSPSPVVLFEGMHALYHLELLELFDLTIFLNVDEPTRWQRKLERDIRERGRTYEMVLNMWTRFTKPMHDVYVQSTLPRAQLLFEDSLAPQAIDAITKIIKQKIAAQENESNWFPD